MTQLIYIAAALISWSSIAFAVPTVIDGNTLIFGNNEGLYYTCHVARAPFMAFQYPAWQDMYERRWLTKNQKAYLRAAGFLYKQAQGKSRGDMLTLGLRPTVKVQYQPSADKSNFAPAGDCSSEDAFIDVFIAIVDHIADRHMSLACCLIQQGAPGGDVGWSGTLFTASTPTLPGNDFCPNEVVDGLEEPVYKYNLPPLGDEPPLPDVAAEAAARVTAIAKLHLQEEELLERLAADEAAAKKAAAEKGAERDRTIATLESKIRQLRVDFEHAKTKVAALERDRSRRIASFGPLRAAIDKFNAAAREAVAPDEAVPSAPTAIERELADLKAALEAGAEVADANLAAIDEGDAARDAADKIFAEKIAAARTAAERAAASAERAAAAEKAAAAGVGTEGYAMMRRYLAELDAEKADMERAAAERADAESAAGNQRGVRAADRARAAVNRVQATADRVRALARQLRAAAARELRPAHN